MTNEPYVLSLDIGTSSIRSKVFNANGTEMASIGAQIPYSMTRSADGGEYIDADQLCEIIFQAIDHAVADAKRQSVPIAAVACCTFWHSVVGVDKNADACTPLLNWSDTRPEIILPDLQKRLDPVAFTKRTGCPMHASYLPAKITWFHHAMPDCAERVRYWMSAGEYLYYKILGRRACSYSMASASGLLDSAKCAWDQETLDAISVEEDQLSLLCDADEGLTGMQPSFVNRWPWLKEAIWFPSLGDGACSNIGSGCSVEDRFAIMVGTSGAMRAVWRGDYREPPLGLWCYRIDRNRPIQGGALSNGGNLFDWMQKSLLLPPADEIEKELQSLKPDGHGLTFLPFLSGQRSPRWNPNKRGTIHGLRLSTQPIQIVQAGLEAIAYRFQLIHDLLSPHFPQDHILVATGGGLLRSPAWIQIIADVFGRAVCVSQVAEASCRGAALVALESLNALNDSSEADPFYGERFEPRAEAHSLYQQALQRHLDYEFYLHDYDG
ncbi:MAG: carbohydrate kinase [Candidatus Omnitrophota bacterium]|jgi:gluconokinase|nr:MAG: carbohydrate kinase [Candidatus Omnitrophota bacterium]